MGQEMEPRSFNPKLTQDLNSILSNLDSQNAQWLNQHDPQLNSRQRWADEEIKFMSESNDHLPPLIEDEPGLTFYPLPIPLRFLSRVLKANSLSSFHYEDYSDPTDKTTCNILINLDPQHPEFCVNPQKGGGNFDTRFAFASDFLVNQLPGVSGDEKAESAKQSVKEILPIISKEIGRDSSGSYFYASLEQKQSAAALIAELTTLLKTVYNYNPNKQEEWIRSIDTAHDLELAYIATLPSS